MQFFENEIKQYTEFALSALNMEIKPCASEFNGKLVRPVTAHIEISGKWQGVISVAMEQELASNLADKMFSCKKGEGSKEEIEDAILEITNVIGGNLKSLLPQPSQLSLPVVDRDEVRLGFPFTEQVSQIDFDHKGSKLKVAIHQANRAETQSQPNYSGASPAQ